MGNKKFCLGILVMALVFGMTVVGCDSDSGGSVGGVYNPLSKTVEWTASSTQYKLVLTDLAADNRSVSRTIVPGGRAYVYILSVGTQGYNTGTATVNNDVITFAPSNDVHSSATSFTITITENTTDGEVTVATTSAQSIPLLTASGTPASNASLPVLNVTGTVGTTSTSNPFVGSWSEEYVSVSVSSNLTWVASAPGYFGSGSYAPIDNVTIIYDARGSFFGYARITTNNQMEADTFDGYYLFTRR